MEHDFWHERWNNNEIFFNQAEPHRHLQAHWSKLGLEESGTVFVPLCGKSVDMMWLSDAGHPVVGNELSTVAVDAFFAENELAATPEAEGDFTVYRGAKHTLWCGDFFQLDAAAVADVDAVFDRASLVALPPAMRARFAQHLVSILPKAAVIFQLTFAYDQAEMNGPPHSVTAEELHDLFGETYDIEAITDDEIIQHHGPFRDRGVTSFRESLSILRPKRSSGTE